MEVRISGRIDRVDVAELSDGVGFWIIDYKTGSSTHYTGAALAEYRRLQLTLYALAVEEVLLAGRSARPLGLAYWLVGEAGPKIALPGRSALQWLEDGGRWRIVREQLRQWVATLVRHIRRGHFVLQPREEHCTQTCAFGQVCRITQSRGVGKEGMLALPMAVRSEPVPYAPRPRSRGRGVGVRGHGFPDQNPSPPAPLPGLPERGEKLRGKSLT